ncbi:TonB-dependent receptor [Shewanella corallii]|uniref:TonB-dependent receptor n=1 Tax=Shewanella corallii TaxID=560080 RepID=A0ABT0NAM0_9GAMM|nr:TonB-dependent receptor [Shewanella corallii]MCL2915508.1 TonB-dependent receptor [Shewanella corallii]
MINTPSKAICSLAAVPFFTLSPIAQALANVAQADEEIEVITVEARKRVEPLQEVPVAVSVLTGKDIERTFNQKVESIDKFTPNVELGKMQFAGGGITAGIRGISFSEVERTFEPAVGMSVDGVFFGTGVGAMVDLLDIESIEVLRGPQGTLFGRNTMGGVINVKRANPTGEFGFKGDLTFGSYGRNDYKAVVNLPAFANDSLAVKFYAYDLNGDLFSKNIFTGDRDKGTDQLTFGTKIMFVPTDEIQAVFSYDRVKDESNYPGVVNLSQNNNVFCIIGQSVFGVAGCESETAAVVEAAGYNFYEYNTEVSQTPFSADITSNLYSLNIDWDITDQLRLTSVTGYQDVEDRLDAEVTGIPDVRVVNDSGAVTASIPFFRVDRPQDYEQFSQEFRVASDFGGSFDFVAGLYYFSSEYSLKPQSGYLLGGLSFRAFAHQEVEAYAAYGELYFGLTDKLSMTVGGRYTYEEKTFDAIRYENGVVDGNPVEKIAFQCPDASSDYIPCRDPKEDWNRFSPRIAFDYKFSDDLMSYISYSQGFRSGGWVGRAAVADGIGPYDPEVLDNYEIGLRSEWFENSFRLNLTAFYMDYKDKQEDYTVAYTSVFDQPSTTSFVENAAKATITGLELESQLQVTEDFRLKAAAGYLDAEYDSYVIPGPGNTPVDVTSERHYRYAPEYTFALGAEYYVDLSDWGELAFIANYKHTAEFWVTPQFDLTGNGRDQIDSYNQLDLSINYDSGSNYRISLFVDNVTNADGRLFRKFDAGSFVFGDKEVGRTYGINLGVNF